MNCRSVWTENRNMTSNVFHLLRSIDIFFYSDDKNRKNLKEFDHIIGVHGCQRVSAVGILTNCCRILLRVIMPYVFI